MTPRTRHLAEMRIAVEQGCSLAEARLRLARLRHAAAEAALHMARSGQAEMFDGRCIIARGPIDQQSRRRLNYGYDD
jgi:hypothetical protein